MTLKRIVEQTDTPAGKAFDLFVLVLILTSLVTFSLETLPDLTPQFRRVLDIIEIVTVSIFTIEYALRILVADTRLRFVTSWYGIIDLFAIAPFYVLIGTDLRSPRIFLLFRVFRLFKAFRYSRAIARFRDAFFSIREELAIFVLVTIAMVFLASVGIYYFESEAQPEHFGSVFHCMWWAIVTLTTVGYGDAVPQTAGGRAFTAIVLLLGLGTVAVPSGLVASALTRTRNRVDQRQDVEDLPSPS
jgi:voltage-gated potassium channel